MQPQGRRSLMNKGNWQTHQSLDGVGSTMRERMWRDWPKTASARSCECVNPGVYLWAIPGMQTHTHSPFPLCWYSFMYGSDWERFPTCPHYQWFPLSFAIIFTSHFHCLHPPQLSLSIPPTFHCLIHHFISLFLITTKEKQVFWFMPSQHLSGHLLPKQAPEFIHLIGLMAFTLRPYHSPTRSSSSDRCRTCFHTSWCSQLPLRLSRCISSASTSAKNRWAEQCVF